MWSPQVPLVNIGIVALQTHTDMPTHTQTKLIPNHYIPTFPYYITILFDTIQHHTSNNYINAANEM